MKLLPTDEQKVNPKSVEQNENNVNIEHNCEEVMMRGVAKVDDDNFKRQGSVTRRDAIGIPQEIPNHLLNAAVAAR